MANQAQQQATICNIVKQCCEDESSFNDLSLQITMFVKSNQSKEVKPIIDTIKKIIKDKNTDSPSKVQALKLLNQCLMQGNNDEFLQYMEKKILSRLSILARYKKESSDIEKGVNIFGGKNYNSRASADFLKLLLLYLQKWGTSYAQYHTNGKQTELNKVYQALVKERIHFPSEEAVLQSLCPDYSHGQYSDTQSNINRSPSSTIQSLNQSINNNIPRNQFNTHQVQNNSNLMNHRPISQSALVEKEKSPLRQSVQLPSQQKLAPMTREQQQQIANQIKTDYKKLYEYQNNAKLTSEILSMGGDSGVIDEELLLQLRGQLTEGKEFAERFLKTLMETQFQIKDKESKIDKILGIIGEIETQLAKILVLKPYSPRALAQIKKRQQEEEEKRKQQTLQHQQIAQQQVRQQAPQLSARTPINNPQENNLRNQQIEDNKNNADLQAQRRSNNNIRSDKSPSEENKQTIIQKNIFNTQQQQVPGPQKQQQQQQQQQQNNEQLDFNFDKNAFKTTFAFGNNDPWGNFGNNGNQANNAMDFNNFNNFNASIDFSKQQFQNDFKWESPDVPKREIRQPQSQSSEKQVSNQKPPQQSIISSEKQQSPDKALSSQQEMKKKESNNMVPQTFIRQPADKLKSFSNLPQLPEAHKPQLMKEPQHISEFVNQQIQPEQIQQPNSGIQKSHDKKLGRANTSSLLNSNAKNGENLNIVGQMGVVQKPFQHKPQIGSYSPEDQFSDDAEDIENTNEKHNFKFPVQQEKLRVSQIVKQGNDGFKWDFDNNNQIQQKPVEDFYSHSNINQLNKDNHQIANGNNNNHKLQLEIDSLQSKLEEFKRQNDELKNQLRKTQEKQRELELNKKEQETKLKEFETKGHVIDNEKVQLKTQLDDALQQIKQLQKYEFMYDDEKFAKIELCQELRELEQKVDEYKKIAERLEARLNKKEKEYDQVYEQMKIYESKIIEMNSQYENDIDDVRRSEQDVKKQLQNDIFEGKKREDDLRVQLQKEIQESKKREQYMREQWKKEIDEYQEQEESLKQQIQLLKDSLKEKDDEIERLKKTKIVAINDQNQQKLVIKSSNIKFNKESSEKLQFKSPKQQNLQEEISVFDFQNPQIQQQMRMTYQEKFDNNLFQSDQNLTNVSKPQYLSNDRPVENNEQKVDPILNQKNNKEIESQSDQQERCDTEELFNNIPSSDSDKDDEVQQKQFSVQQQNQEFVKPVFEVQQQEQQNDKIMEDFFKSPEKQLIVQQQQVSQQNQQYNDHDFNFGAFNEPKNEENKFWDFFDQKQEVKFQVKESKELNIKQVQDNQNYNEITFDEQPKKQEIEKLFNSDSKNEKSNLLEQTLEKSNSKEFPQFIIQPQLITKTSSEPLEVKEEKKPIMKDTAEVQKEKFDFNSIKDIISEDSQEITVFYTNNTNQNEFAPRMTYNPPQLSPLLPEKNVEQKTYELKQFSPKNIQSQLEFAVRKNSSNEKIKNADGFNALDDLLQPNIQPVVNQLQQQNHTSPAQSNQEIFKSNNINNNYAAPQLPQGQIPNQLTQLTHLPPQIPVQQQQLMQQQFVHPQSQIPQYQQLPQQQAPNLYQPPNQINNHPPHQIQTSPQINNPPPQQQLPQLQSTINKSVSNPNLMQPINQMSVQQNIVNSQNPQHTQLINQFNGQQNIVAPQMPQQMNQVNQQQNIQHPIQNPQPQIPQQQQQQQQKDVNYDKSQFTTQNTEQLVKQQQMQQQMQQKINPQAFLQMMLLNFFRKSLASNKSVLYEDQNIQIGLLSDYQQNLVRMRLFFGNKHQPVVQQIAFTQQMKPVGFEAQITRDLIPQIVQGQQEPIDITIKIDSYQLSIPIYSLSYKCNNTPVSNLPIRLPLILLKICQGLSIIDNNPQVYIQKWETECSQRSESKIVFNIDFNQCRSLTQLKEILKFGNNAMSFVDGVEQQKNIVCGGTIFAKDNLFALVKITVTGNGQNCEIIGRSNDVTSEEPGRFCKFVIGNILEMIALKVIGQ